jgi:uncharacterized protein
VDHKQIEKVARTQMLARKEQNEREPGWLFYHGIRTANIAREICELLNFEINVDVVFAGALFHDIGKGSEPHNLEGAKLTKRLLEKYCTEDESSQVCEIVRLHNQRHDSKNHPPGVRVVQDADLIDHVGPIVPWLAFYWSGTHNETIHDHIRFVTSEKNDKYRKGMRSRLNFDVSVTMFDERVRWEDSFFETFRKVYFEGVWHDNGTHTDGPPATLHGRR